MGLFGLFGKKKSDGTQTQADTSAQDKQQQFASYDQANSGQANAGMPVMDQASPAMSENPAPTDCPAVDPMTAATNPADDHNDLTDVLSSSATAVPAPPSETAIPTPPAENPALSPVEEPVADTAPAPEPTVTEPVSAPTELNPAPSTDSTPLVTPTETPIPEAPVVTPAPDDSAVPEPPAPDNTSTPPAAPMQ